MSKAGRSHDKISAQNLSKSILKHTLSKNLCGLLIFFSLRFRFVRNTCVIGAIGKIWYGHADTKSTNCRLMGLLLASGRSLHLAPKLCVAVHTVSHFQSSLAKSRCRHQKDQCLVVLAHILEPRLVLEENADEVLFPS